MWLTLTKINGTPLLVNLNNVCCIACDHNECGVTTLLYNASGEFKWDEVKESPDVIKTMMKDKQYV